MKIQLSIRCRPASNIRISFEYNFRFQAGVSYSRCFNFNYSIIFRFTHIFCQRIIPGFFVALMLTVFAHRSGVHEYRQAAGESAATLRTCAGATIGFQIDDVG
jgi:hypothetical protein